MPGIRPRNVPTARRPENMTSKEIGFAEKMRQAAGEKYRGITTADGPIPGLFPLQVTGVPADGPVRAARAYLASLSQAERAEGNLPMESETWRHWRNGARYVLRHGMCLEDLGDAKRELALDVLRQSLSGKGFALARDIMKLNYSLGILSGYEVDFDEWLYWLTIYGEPSATGAWGWQLDGHHLNINCAFIGDQMVLTPTFVGAEPVTVDFGPYAGIRIFRMEEADALSLMQSLDATQRKAAIIAEEMPRDLFTGPARDNFELNYEGIPFHSLGEIQKKELLNLVRLYITRMRPGHAEVWMDKITEMADEMHFAWVGGTDDDSVFYYRVHSPVILVEFEHVHGLVFDNEEPSRVHVHTVVRTPNGNDYGRDLLRQHHETMHCDDPALG